MKSEKEDYDIEKMFDNFRRNSFVLWLENKSGKVIPREELMNFIEFLSEHEGFDEILDLQKKYVLSKTKPKKLREKEQKNIRKLQENFIDFAYLLDEFLKSVYGKQLVDDYYYYSENFYDEIEEDEEEDDEDEMEEGEEGEEKSDDEDEINELGEEINEFEMNDDDLNDHELDILFSLIY
jgi:hypothetical protein